MRALRISNNPIIYVPALYSTGMFWYDPGVRYVTFLWVSTESLSVAPLWSSHRIYRLADGHQPPVTGRSLTLHMYCIFRPTNPSRFSFRQHDEVTFYLAVKAQASGLKGCVSLGALLHALSVRNPIFIRNLHQSAPWQACWKPHAFRFKVRLISNVSSAYFPSTRTTISWPPILRMKLPVNI